FKPDLPKGYQISQYELPIVEHGRLEITLEDGVQKVIGITRAHLEEDAGKSLHEEFDEFTGVDLNRAGTPLIEVVSEPDMRSAKEAILYMKKIHSIVRYLGISDGNMQEGSFRCDANVSLRPAGDAAYGTRAEIKNLNSFRFVERAIEFEIERQAAVLEDGGEIVQETRLFDAGTGETRSMRSKEEANDYRYFPDPDLLPVVIQPDMVEAIRGQLPELPSEKASRFRTQYGLNAQDAETLAMSRETAEYFEHTARDTDAKAKLVVNWITGELSAALNQDHLEITESPVSSTMLAGLLNRIEDGTISGKIAKDVFRSMWTGEGDADSIIESRGLRQITDDSEIERLVDQVLQDNPEQVEQFRSGKDKVFGFFVGRVMKLSQGKANPKQVNGLLRKKLG
ncbi:MAG: Asp-tRNA(Asn)/Glu-tRNA(Gln) amidotransferase subunit GatB, partial [Proteobacteria bacterium]|nr:Asp-tRNA(Asn)/Glu-tRNA(Gln) amidotransferase subunit GatB [Pseudomonadota bacterium]